MEVKQLIWQDLGARQSLYTNPYCLRWFSCWVKLVEGQLAPPHHEASMELVRV